MGSWRCSCDPTFRWNAMASGSQQQQNSQYRRRENEADRGDLDSIRNSDNASGITTPTLLPQPTGPTPTLFHRVRHDKSILALVVSDKYIFAGTQGGEILVGFDCFLRGNFGDC